MTSVNTSGTADITIYHDDPPREEHVTERYSSVEAFAIGLVNILRNRFPQHYEIIIHWLVPRKWITFDTHGDIQLEWQNNAVIDVDDPREEYDIKVPYSNEGRAKATFIKD